MLDTQLADRKATAVSTPAETQQRTETVRRHPSEPPESLQDALTATRADLTEAQRSRAELQDRLARVSSELDRFRKRNTQDGRRVNALEGERMHLQMRLKDRDEELRGKAKLLDVCFFTFGEFGLPLTIPQDFQDELASLNLQLNMAEEQSNRLQRENQELVDRWMARMGKEAEAMNDTSKYS